MGVTQDKLVFRQTRTTCIHSYTHYCVYNQGALHTGGISGVFLVNLKKLVKCTIKKDNNKKKRHTLSSIKCSTYMLVPALCFGIRRCGYPVQKPYIILIKLYMQAAQPKASNRSPPSLNWTVQQKRAHTVSVLKKLIPVFLLNIIFNPYPWKNIFGK